jgi:azurin/HEAT repeat protein
MYICDFYNPIIGQTTFSLRDERRGSKFGRIWRVVPKGAKLAHPPQIAGAPVPVLLELLKSPHYRYRYWAKRELHERPAAEVKAALDPWVARLDPKDPGFRHHQVEAIWTYRTVGGVNAALLREVLNSDSHLARSAATGQLRYWSGELGDGIEQLRQRANDDNSLVRMEAVIAASYIGTREALAAVLGVLDRPMGRHLRYAIRTALASENLARFWNRNEASDPTARQISAFFVNFDQEVAKYGTVGSVAPRDERSRADKVRGGEVGPSRVAQDAAFDKQNDVARINLAAVPGRMIYDVTAFSVKAGQPVKLTFTNPDAMAHNVVIVAPGAETEVGTAGNEMAKDPDGIKKDFVPTSAKVLFHTKLVDPGRIEVLRFRAPKAPGDYPYLCTYPGHWVVMRGVMRVAP